MILWQNFILRYHRTHLLIYSYKQLCFAVSIAGTSVGVWVAMAWFTFPISVIKQCINLVQLVTACINTARIDLADRAKATDWLDGSDVKEPERVALTFEDWLFSRISFTEPFGKTSRKSQKTNIFSYQPFLTTKDRTLSHSLQSYYENS